MFIFFLFIVASISLGTFLLMKSKGYKNQVSLEERKQRQLVEEQEADEMMKAAEEERPFSISKK